MPKIKTNRGAAKRFKLTASGKLKRKKQGLRHILTNKAQGRKSDLGKSTVVSKADEKNMKKLVPYL